MKLVFVLGFLLSVNIALVSCQDLDPNITPPKFTLSPEDKIRILYVHNTYRNEFASGMHGFSKGSNLNELVWDDDLASKAQSWADRQTASAHSEEADRKTAKFSKVGENLFQYNSLARPTKVLWKAAINSWYLEFRDFKDRSPDFASYKGSSHYAQFAQLIWAKTTSVGCGASYAFESGWYTTTIVCHYGPAGNEEGHAVYHTQGDVCSNCDNKQGCSSKYSSLCKSN